MLNKLQPEDYIMKTKTHVLLYIGTRQLIPGQDLDGTPPKVFYLCIPRRINPRPNKYITNEDRKLSFYFRDVLSATVVGNTLYVRASYYCQGDPK